MKVENNLIGVIVCSRVRLRKEFCKCYLNVVGHVKVFFILIIV